MTASPISRRALLGGIGIAAAMSAGGARAAQAMASASAAPSPGTKLFLLGTGGGPVLGGERGMAASALVVGDAVYLIDCGYGACERLSRAGLSVAAIGSVFITHNHADHLLDYGSLLFFSWLQGRREELRVYGPPPLRKITDDLLSANALPLKYYKDDMRSPPMPPVRVTEIAGAGPVMQDPLVRVSSTIVHHPPVEPALAYRFDTPDRSIVFSGDTSPSDALIALAKGADVLVHEACDVAKTIEMMKGAPPAKGDARINGEGSSTPKGYDPAKFAEHVLKAHTSVADAGRVAAAAGVRTLVLHHLSPGSSKLVPDAAWIAQARPYFAGEIVVAHDGAVL
jgi:ribonuclease BN (tRNA processing enzyme)